MFKINETMLKFRLFFLQISPNPQSFLSFLVKLTAQTDVAYIVHFQSSADKRRNFFTAKWVTISNTCIFVLKCTPVSLLRVKISAAATGWVLSLSPWASTLAHSRLSQRQTIALLWVTAGAWKTLSPVTRALQLT